MNKILITLLLLNLNFTYSQSAFEDWDVKYGLVSLEQVLKSEEAYAENVENDPEAVQYYQGLNFFRFIANFTGNVRTVKLETVNSLRRVLKLRTGNSEEIINLISKEFEFQVGKTKIWMPIQNQLIDPFLEEIDKGKDVLLYTLFTNEHSVKGELINTFLISEFSAEWD